MKEDSIDRNPHSNKIHKPPPVFLRGVVNCVELIKRVRDIAGNEQYCTKCLAYNVTKIICVTPETCRKQVRYCEGNNILYRTYRLEEERAYRTVIKYLHHSTDNEDIRQELYELGHNVQNIINVQHRTAKEPLNLFFADL